MCNAVYSIFFVVCLSGPTWDYSRDRILLLKSKWDLASLQLVKETGDMHLQRKSTDTF